MDMLLSSPFQISLVCVGTMKRSVFGGFDRLSSLFCFVCVGVWNVYNHYLSVTYSYCVLNIDYREAFVKITIV
jgi:hypothetical protein